MGWESLTGPDAALWHTCAMAAARAAGRTPHPPVAVSPPVRPGLGDGAADGDGEVMLAAGPFTRYVLAAGDATYQKSSAFFFATGAVGLAATAAVAVGQAWGNSRRKRRAERAARPRWDEAGGGLLTVSTHGFYLSGPHGVSPWPWAAVDTCEVGRRGLVDLTGRSTTGPVRWLLETDWAELVFAMWALDRHPGHPRLADGAWLPPGWLERVAARVGPPAQPGPTLLGPPTLPGPPAPPG